MSSRECNDGSHTGGEKTVKKEINPRTFYAILAGALIVIGWLMWVNMESPANRPGYEEAKFREVEKWAKEHNFDLKKDGLTARVYYRFHPEEKPPAGASPAPDGPKGMPGSPS